MSLAQKGALIPQQGNLSYIKLEQKMQTFMNQNKFFQESFLHQTRTKDAILHESKQVFQESFLHQTRTKDANIHESKQVF